MRKSDTCACNPARHKPTRRGPATGPVALCTSPYISTPSPPHDRPLRTHTLDVRNERRLVQWVARPNMRGTGVPVRLLPSPEKSGGLNGSVQHLLAVYLPEFENPKFFLDADSSAAPPPRALLENTLTSLFV